MSGREGLAVRDRDQRIGETRSSLADRALEQLGRAVGGGVGEEDEHDRLDPTAEKGERQRERDPDGAPAADPREPDEDLVERMPPVSDDPALQVTIETVQTGASCFVRSISSCRSNGFPTNPCAPPAAACASASSTLPLNMTTGIAPAPHRS
jgi:hypothetical protein